MNYIVTPDELQTLAALLGAENLFCFTARALTEAQAAVSLCSLVGKGLLLPSSDGFACLPAAEPLFRAVAEPERLLLLADTTETQRRLCGYYRDGCLTLLEPIAQRPGEYALRLRAPEELAGELEEDGYLPEEGPAPEGKADFPAFLELPLGALLGGERTPARLLAVTFGPDGGAETGRAAVFAGNGAWFFADAGPGRERVGPYRRAAFSAWLEQGKEGAEDGAGGRVCARGGEGV